MKINKKWMCVLATALGCVAPAFGFGNEVATEKTEDPTAVQQAAVSRWEDPARHSRSPVRPAPWPPRAPVARADATSLVARPAFSG